MRVVVVGAGIAGLTAAAALARDGHDVVVLESRRQASGGAGISLWPNALAALDRIGLGDAVRSRSARVGGGALRWRDGTWIRKPPPGALAASIGEELAVILRGTLSEVLTSASPIDSVRHGVAVRSVRTVRSEAVVTMADGGEMRADLVVGADGTHSRVARGFNGRLSSTYTGYTAWRGLADTSIDPELAGEVIGPRSQFGVVPLADGRTYWFATIQAPEGVVFDDELVEVARVGIGWPDPVAEVIAATPESALMRNDLHDRPTARRWHDGRTVIVGDAAHPMRPHLGQGGCQAIEDAVVLAAVLRRDPDVASALSEYVRIRRRRVRGIVAESRTIGTVVNARPAMLWGRAIRAGRLIPESILLRHLGHVAGREAFARQLR
ncbi:FAD-dependent oxidoreductase [Gordonia neofelifaecis]|uniref:Salicylate hydroxylase n=1 Tax=Gordonia neofelifaecis NRRL B-59395 TaxID=644548 RepID=F1YI21_9ACTN|nr:FAD-dependent oxidoreductase [Gordonia neofelifaecis]EGD55575.1 salicylate hydroxylase [Gordonia neofelifaecis NRRL B-59395]